MNQGGIPDTKVINSNDGKLSSNTANKKISSKKVNTNYVYIRVPRGENLHVYSTQNDTNSNTVATLNGGIYKVDIQNEGNGWSYIETTNNDNVSGYVLTSALKAAENNYKNSL